MNLVRKLWQRSKDLLPTSGFYFDRPLVLLQSDDWGRVGLRDQEGLEQLQSAGLALGERPYDFYTLENAEDLSRLKAVLKRHRDSNGRSPCLEMNFILANLDFTTMKSEGWREIRFVSISEGWPDGWDRPGLMEAYKSGIEDRVFHPALHGISHFCRESVARNANAGGERAELLHALWQAGTPYIHWRMPWIGYEYWDPEKSADDRFLPEDVQRDLVGKSVGIFAKAFSSLPRSACAPGYRANDDTQRAWAQHGIQIAQHGPETRLPPHFDQNGVLQLSRTIEFEPATDPNFSVETCMNQAARCFQQGLPAIVSMHSINFHSTVRDFRSRTLACLDEFFSAIESKYADVLYLRDEDLYELIQGRPHKAEKEAGSLHVTARKFTKTARRAV